MFSNQINIVRSMFLLCMLKGCLWRILSLFDKQLALSNIGLYVTVNVLSAATQQTYKLLLLVGDPPIGIRLQDLGANQNMCYALTTTQGGVHTSKTSQSKERWEREKEREHAEMVDFKTSLTHVLNNCKALLKSPRMVKQKCKLLWYSPIKGVLNIKVSLGNNKLNA